MLHVPAAADEFRPDSEEEGAAESEEDDDDEGDSDVDEDEVRLIWRSVRPPALLPVRERNGWQIASEVLVASGARERRCVHVCARVAPSSGRRRSQ